MCFHDRLREFTFKNGDTIKCCLDCTTFDNARIDYLKTGHYEIPKAKGIIHWNLILDKAGLAMTSGTHEWLLYVGDCQDIMRELSTQTLKKKREYTEIDDNDWCNKQKPFPHTHSMPRALKNYCVNCRETVIDSFGDTVRVTKGCYMPVDHGCATRVYDLQGKLLEVKR